MSRRPGRLVTPPEGLGVEVGGRYPRRERPLDRPVGLEGHQPDLVEVPRRGDGGQLVVEPGPGSPGCRR